VCEPEEVDDGLEYLAADGVDLTADITSDNASGTNESDDSEIESDETDSEA
jgi:hypothetical protein